MNLNHFRFRRSLTQKAYYQTQDEVKGLVLFNLNLYLYNFIIYC